MSDEPTAPFTFRPAPAKPSRKTTLEKVEEMPEQSFAAQQVAAVEEQNASRPRRSRKSRIPLATHVPGPLERKTRKTRKRRTRLPDDVVVLKACLKQLRTLDPKDALRTVETLRVLFK